MDLSIHTDNQTLKQQLAAFLDETNTVKKKVDQNRVVDVVVEHISKVNDKKQVIKFVSDNFRYHDNINRSELLNVLNENLKKDANCKKQLKRMVFDYLSKHDKLNIEGFLNFRLKEYNVFLNESMETLTEEYLVEKEYEDFICLLNYFIEAQEPLVDKVHIVPYGEERYRLFDENGVEITNYCMREYMGELAEEVIHYDDFLLSTLISLAPIQIVLHHPEKVLNRNVINTIQKVFGEKLSWCDDCSICAERQLEYQVLH